MVESGEFREDLFHRLNVIRIHVPKLAERREDIPQLLTHFLTAAGNELDVEAKTLSEDALALLTQLPWPGNVRQLGNVLERASILANGGRIETDHLPAELRARPDSEPGSESGPPGGGGGDGDDDGSPDFSLRSAERDQIIRALDSAGGKRVQAARLLGLSRRTLYRKLEKYGIR